MEVTKLVRLTGCVAQEDRKFLSLTSLVPLPCPVAVHLGDECEGDLATAKELRSSDGEDRDVVRLQVHSGGGHNIVTALRNRGELAEILGRYLEPTRVAELKDV